MSTRKSQVRPKGSRAVMPPASPRISSGGTPRSPGAQRRHNPSAPGRVNGGRRAGNERVPLSPASVASSSEFAKASTWSAPRQPERHMASGLKRGTDAFGERGRRRLLPIQWLLALLSFLLLFRLASPRLLWLLCFVAFLPRPRAHLCALSFSHFGSSQKAGLRHARGNDWSPVAPRHLTGKGGLAGRKSAVTRAGGSRGGREAIANVLLSRRKTLRHHRLHGGFRKRRVEYHSYSSSKNNGRSRFWNATGVREEKIFN
ncbi:hypothetical protein MRX96_009680 [Rhipicephalus microplus]